MSAVRLLIAIVSLVAISVGAWLSWSIVAPPAEPVRATVLPSPAEVPAFSLVDQDGAAFGREDFQGQWSIVFFGFTHCPDVCPLTMQVLASARAELAQGGQSPLPRIVLVSVDPDRDTPELMREYVSYFDSEAIGLTGSMAELRKLTDGLGVFFQRASGDDENYLVDHSAVVLVIDPAARFRALFSTPHEIDTFVHDLPLIVAAQ